MNNHSEEMEKIQISQQQDRARVETLFELNRFVDAENWCRKKLAEEPEDIEWQYLLARALLGQERYQDADDMLVNCIELDPEFSFAYYLLSITSHANLFFSRELDCALIAVKLDPEEPVFLQRLAQAYLQNGQIRKAQQVAQQLTEIAPDNADLFKLLGDIEFELFDYQKAEQAFRKGLSIEPEDLHLMTRLAASLTAQKNKVQEAIEVLYNIVQLHPTEPNFARNLFFVMKEWIDKQAMLGKKQQALATLPQPLQYFYHDYKSRLSFFESFSKRTWLFLWITGLLLVTVIFAVRGQ